MADLLGSILGSMEKPPSLPSTDKHKLKVQQKQAELRQEKEKEHLNKFRAQIQKDVECFVKDPQRKKFKFKAMPKIYRAVIHDVAEVASLVAFSFGEEDIDRHIILWKKEFAPSDEELAAHRQGEEWTDEKAKQILAKKCEEKTNKKADGISSALVKPATNYKDKYKHLIGQDAGKQAASSTVTNRTYGFVSSENKRDLRTIEEVLAESKARKKQKTDIHPSQEKISNSEVVKTGNVQNAEVS